MIKQTDTQKLAQLVDYMKAVPFDVSRDTLYSARELYEGFDPKDDLSYATCYDQRVYAHYIAKGKQADAIDESLARTLHDHGIQTAMDAFFETNVRPTATFEYMPKYFLRNQLNLAAGITVINVFLASP